MILAISRRKLEMPVDQVISAINSLDLRLLSLENVEILQRMVPTEQEVALLYYFANLLFVFYIYTKVAYSHVRHNLPIQVRQNV